MIEFKTERPIRARNLADLHRSIEKRVILGVLKAKDGNVAAAAVVCGIERTSFYRLLKRHGMRVKSGYSR